MGSETWEDIPDFYDYLVNDVNLEQFSMMLMSTLPDSRRDWYSSIDLQESKNDIVAYY